ncbi:MAG: sigma-70 family RNA polymerase sigma factor [Clostridia bacterium]|nr:sigma-70 family RNA polymerase sigma factor [Clostridia bacterium]
MESPKSDNDIIELFFARDEDALRLTAKRYGRFVYSVCYRILRQRQDSEECRNTTYYKAWDAIPPERPRCYQAFLARIARATAIDRLRERTRQKRSGGFLSSLDDLSDMLADGGSAADEAEAHELASILNGFLSRLDEKKQICFIKRYYFNSPVSAVSREMGVPRSTVYSMLAAVKAELKEHLNKEGYPV